MDVESLVPILIGMTVIAIVGGLGLVTSHKSGTLAEDRLAGLMGMRRARAKKQDLASGILARPRGDRSGASFVLDEARSQRRKPEPALRAGRRQLFVQEIYRNLGRLCPGGDCLRPDFSTSLVRRADSWAVSRLASVLLADQAQAQANSPVCRRDARSGRADQPGIAVGPRALVGAQARCRGDEGPGRRRVQSRVRGAESGYSDRAVRSETWQIAYR